MEQGKRRGLLTGAIVSSWRCVFFNLPPPSLLALRSFAHDSGCCTPNGEAAETESSKEAGEEGHNDYNRVEHVWAGDRGYFQELYGVCLFGLCRVL